MRRLVIGVADGVMKVDGRPIYEAKDLRVGLFVEGEQAAPPELPEQYRTQRPREPAVMRRVAVTGLGIICPIGNSTQEVIASLREGRSGITAAEDYRRMGFRSQVAGTLKVDLDATVDRRARRFMGDGAAFSFLAMQQALTDAGLDESDVVNERTGLIIGSGRTFHESACRRSRYRTDRARKGAQTGWSFRGAKGDVVDVLGRAGDLVQDQRGLLFHQFGLRDQRPLHRQCGRD